MTGFNLDISGMVAGLSDASIKAEVAVSLYAQTSAVKLQNYARKNRTWTDRSGSARQRLTGTSTKIANGYRLTLAHGVTYGKYLELAHEKKYAIIPKTLQEVGEQEIMPGFQHLLERL